MFYSFCDRAVVACSDICRWLWPSDPVFPIASNWHGVLSSHVLKCLQKLSASKAHCLSTNFPWLWKKTLSWHQKNELWRKTAAMCGICCSGGRDRVWSGVLEVCGATIPDSHVTFPSLCRFAYDKPPDGAPLGTGSRHGVIHFIVCVWQPLTLMKFWFLLTVLVFCFNLDRYNFPWLCLNLVIKTWENAW